MSNRGILPARHEAAQKIGAAVAAFLAAAPHPTLRDHNHTIDNHGRAALGRLGNSGRNSDRMTAAEAIVATLPPEAWPSLFGECVIAEWRSRSHKKRIDGARTVLERSKEADKALSTVARFLGRTGPFADPDSPKDDALAVLRTAIAARRRSSEYTRSLSSRTKTEAAARAHGVGWIRDALESICRRHGTTCEPRHVAIIATAALGMGEVTANVVDKAPSVTERLAAI
jgi:hypothetical protein